MIHRRSLFLICFGRPGRLFLACGAVTVIFAVLSQPPALAQQVDISGRVVDAEVAVPLPQVVVEIVTGSGRVVGSATTDSDGEFRLIGMPPGRYRVVFSAFGYETHRLDGVAASEGSVSVGVVELTSRAFRLNPVVVSVSRDGEKALDAPASVYSVSTEEIEGRPATTSVDHVRGLPAVDIITMGLARHSVAVRGFNGVANDALLFLTDNRRSAVPSMRFNVFDAMPTTDDDLERIEVVLGPASALYGPNSAHGVLHVITRSPLDDQGTTVSLSGGERGVFQGSFRHAGLASENVGYKISGMYFRGDEWRYTDPVEAGIRERAIDAGADPDTLLIGQRNFDTGRYTVDGRLDFRLDDRSTLLLSGGLNHAISNIVLSPSSAVQLLGANRTYLQAQFRRGQLFLQAYGHWLDQNDRSYMLRNGRRVPQDNFEFVGQIQHATDLGDRQRFIYGADLIRSVPNTYGVLHGHNEDEDEITEIGGYLQSETLLSPMFEVVAAARLDYHDLLGELVFSPRAALVFKPAEGHDLRLTYNRAFRQPGNTMFFIDLVVIPGALYPRRAAGGADTGFSFRRDCSSPLVEEGLCMRSPFTSDGVGGPLELLPLDATLFWDEAVEIVAAGDPEAGNILALMAQPDAAQVGSVMRLGGEAVGDVADVDPLRPEITNTIEVGYKGFIADRLFLGLDVYYRRVEDFIGPALVITPNVFMERVSVEAYIASEADRLGLALTEEEIAALAAEMADAPVAIVTPEDPPDSESPTDVLQARRNFGEVDLWGADVGATLLATRELSFTGSYSFVSENFFANLDGHADVSLNAPRNKASLVARYANGRLGLAAELRGRYVEGFQVIDGRMVGPVDKYTLLDASVTYALPLSYRTELMLSGLNIFDHRHQEIPGAPYIGRLVMLQLRVSF
jgi:iron complex outermembrane receptor protein